MFRLFRFESRKRLKTLRWRTIRFRLTAIYGGLFLASGAVLLVICYLIVSHLLPDPATHHGALRAVPPTVISAASNQRNRQLHALLVDLVVALVCMAGLSLLLGWLVAGHVLRPLRTITSSTRNISARNLHERLALDGPNDELKELGDTIDGLLARLEQSFDSQRQFVANASHELRTPLTFEQALLEETLSDPSPSLTSWRRTGQRVLTNSVHQARLIDALLALASSEGGLGHTERIDLPAICESVLLRRKDDVERVGLHLETTLRSSALYGDSRLIERLVANLVDNAVSYNIAGGHVQVSTALTDGKAVLSVTNTGPVIPGGDIERLFQPFQRLDPRRAHYNDGHGLGLSIVRAITTAHGATITAHPEPEGGLRVQITFPPSTKSGHEGTIEGETNGINNRSLQLGTLDGAPRRSAR